MRNKKNETVVLTKGGRTAHKFTKNIRDGILIVNFLDSDVSNDLLEFLKGGKRSLLAIYENVFPKEIRIRTALSVFWANQVIEKNKNSYQLTADYQEKFNLMLRFKEERKAIMALNNKVAQRIVYELLPSVEEVDLSLNQLYKKSMSLPVGESKRRPSKLVIEKHLSILIAAGIVGKSKKRFYLNVFRITEIEHLINGEAFIKDSDE